MNTDNGRENVPKKDDSGFEVFRIIDDNQMSAYIRFEPRYLLSKLDSAGDRADLELLIYNDIRNLSGGCMSVLQCDTEKGIINLSINTKYHGYCLDAVNCALEGVKQTLNSVLQIED